MTRQKQIETINEETIRYESLLETLRDKRFPEEDQLQAYLDCGFERPPLRDWNDWWKFLDGDVDGNGSLKIGFIETLQSICARNRRIYCRLANEVAEEKRKGVAEARTKWTVQSSDRLDGLVCCALKILKERSEAKKPLPKPTLNELAGLVEKECPDLPRPTQKAIYHQLEKERDGRLKGKIKPAPNRSRD